MPIPLDEYHSAHGDEGPCESGLEIESEAEDVEEKVIELIASKLLNKPLKKRTLEGKFPYDCFKIEKGYSTLMSGLLAYSVNKILTEKYKVPFEVCEYNYNKHFASVDIGQEEEIRCLIKGGCLFKYKETMIGIGLASHGMVCSFEIISNQEHREIAEEVFSDLVGIMKYDNFYKGAKVEIVAYEPPKFIKKLDYTKQDIILDEEIWKEIDDNIIDYLGKLDIYQSKKIPTRRGILFEGLPGTGKTLLLKVLCSLLPYTCIVLTANSVYDRADVYSAYEFAKDLAPSIVFWEDLDLFGESRRYGGDNTVLGAILQVLDGARVYDGVITVASTNQPEVLDSALTKRPARFDRKIKFEVPNAGLRTRMLERFLEPFEIEDKVYIIDQVANKTNKYTGAALKELVITAYMNANRRNSGKLNLEDFSYAIEKLNKCKFVEGSIGLLK